MEMAVKVTSRRKAERGPWRHREGGGRAGGQHSLRVGARSLVPD